MELKGDTSVYWGGQGDTRVAGDCKRKQGLQGIARVCKGLQGFNGISKVKV